MTPPPDPVEVESHHRGRKYHLVSAVEGFVETAEVFTRVMRVRMPLSWREGLARGPILRDKMINECKRTRHPIVMSVLAGGDENQRDNTWILASRVSSRDISFSAPISRSSSIETDPIDLALDEVRVVNKARNFRSPEMMPLILIQIVEDFHLAQTKAMM